MKRSPSGSGLTLLHSWSQLVRTPRGLVCAALPPLLFAHCPACCPSELPVLPCLWPYIDGIQAPFAFSPAQVFIAESRGLGIVWPAAGGWVTPKGCGFSARWEPFGSKYLSVLREKPAGPTSGCFVLMYFLCGTLYPVFKVSGGEPG